MIELGTDVTIRAEVMGAHHLVGTIRVTGPGQTLMASFDGPMSSATKKLSGLALANYLAALLETGMNARSPLRRVQTGVHESEMYTDVPLF